MQTQKMKGNLGIRLSSVILVPILLFLTLESCGKKESKAVVESKLISELSIYNLPSQ